MRLPYSVGQTFSLAILPKPAEAPTPESNSNPVAPEPGNVEDPEVPSKPAASETVFVLRPRVQKPQQKVVVDTQTKETPPEADGLFVSEGPQQDPASISSSTTIPSNFAVTPDGGRVHVFGKIPKTTCHTSAFLANQPHHHILHCGHEVYTDKPGPCGPNCKLDGSALRPTGTELKCEDPKCMAAWKRRAKAEASLFRTTNGQRYVMPSRKCFLSSAEGKANASAMADRRFEASREHKSQKQETRPQGSVAARKTAVPDRGRERERERSPGRDKKKAKDDYRERESLAYWSTRFQAANGHTVKFESYNTAPRQAKPDFEFDKEIPHSHLLETGPNSADFSHPEHKVTAMHQGVIINSSDYQPEPEEPEEPNFGFNIQQKYCTCRSDADENLVECVDCGRSYHPYCVGKALQDLSAYHDHRATESRALDAEQHRESEDFTCIGCDGKREAAKLKKKRVFGWGEEALEKARAAKLFQMFPCSEYLEESVDVCDLCNVQILRKRFQCRLCEENFDLCMECARDPAQTVQHQHPEMGKVVGNLRLK